MRVLIIGSGGREHALSWKVARSGKAEKIYCAPGNGGTAQEGENIPLKDSDVAGLVSFAKGNVIDFVIPGPELPLTLGRRGRHDSGGYPLLRPEPVVRAA